MTVLSVWCFIIIMDRHLCVVQTVDRNPFKTCAASRCVGAGQSKKRRTVKCKTSKCLVSYLVSLLLGREQPGHAPLLAEYQVSLALIITSSGVCNSYQRYQHSHRTFLSDGWSVSLEGWSQVPSDGQWVATTRQLLMFLSVSRLPDVSWISVSRALTSVSLSEIFYINEIQIGQFCP